MTTSKGWHCYLKCCGHTLTLWMAPGTGLQQWSTLPHIVSSPSEWQFVSVMWIIFIGDWCFKLQYKGENFGVGSLHCKEWWDDAKMCKRWSRVTVFICLARDFLLCSCSYSYSWRLWRTEKSYCFAEASLVNSWKWSIRQRSFPILFIQCTPMCSEHTQRQQRRQEIMPENQIFF